MPKGIDPQWFTAEGQALARYPEGYEAYRPRVPVAGGEYPEQWSITQVIPANTTLEILNLNLNEDDDHCMVWSENSNGGFGCRITVQERVPRAQKLVSFDVGSGGGNQAMIRGAVKITATTGVGPCTLALWVYPGDLLPRAPIQEIQSVAAVLPNPGAWTAFGTQSWPPKDRNNLELGGANPFNWRFLDEAGNIIMLRNGRQVDQIYHPPRAQLQVQNPGAVSANFLVSATWRRTF